MRDGSGKFGEKYLPCCLQRFLLTNFCLCQAAASVVGQARLLLLGQFTVVPARSATAFNLSCLCTHNEAWLVAGREPVGVSR